MMTLSSTPNTALLVDGRLSYSLWTGLAAVVLLSLLVGAISTCASVS